MASPIENSKEDKLQKEEELTLEERAVLLSEFDKLGAKPKTTSTTGLKIWLAQMDESSKQVEELKKAETTKQADTTKQPERKPNIEVLNKLGTTQSIPVTTTNVTSSVTSNPAVMSSGNVQTLTSLPNYTPRISTFFGEPGKGEATYNLWRYEVDSLRKSTFAPHIVDLLIRRSLRGEAEKVAMRLGPEASLDQLLNKLEVNYGLSIQHDKLMEEFYSAKQKPNEDITAWANRLEDLLYKASKQKLVRPEDINDKLCSMFWSGLDPKLRETSGHLHFMIKDFDKLKLAMREQEVDLKRKLDLNQPK
ncbi:unnamed protein product [Mytilus coruscus]|uniref:Uncharacterized protein n=1 Tax=Mytilus coruscus TaxID=42192 RepID=A0A6J8D1X3_MYTCO|nr:unnamed protein product [Mytilus coruscus]